ncbi:capsular polysaccharide synthesis protein [Lelliottia amnigena]|uniref:capsular polysaccharide synthesis protein n=1 Tax=Lelliottia amnigena TaxID=61646 RepID=UPI00293BF734|nr:capsular polysaccharide synthesis protein [Lelliottia amnigena]
MYLKILNKLIKKISRWYKKTRFSCFKKIVNYLERKKKDQIFSMIDDLAVQPEAAAEKQQGQTRIIWICWFQGFDCAPELVKRCIESIQLHSPNANVVILTDENISQYLSLPEFITTKYQNGLIGKAHYSDIVRCSLLYKYGGVWIDSTVFITKSIPESFYEYSFSSLRFDSIDSSLSKGYWTTYFLACHKENTILKFVRDVLYSYWRIHDTSIEYFLTDYIFLYARERNSQCREMMDQQPVTGNYRFLMRQNMSLIPEAETAKALSNDPIGIYKLSHKEKYLTSINGHPTLYSNILDGSFKIN